MRYVGQLHDGLPHGFGVAAFENSNEFFAGRWFRGAIQGHGTFLFADGHQLEGTCVTLITV